MHSDLSCGCVAEEIEEAMPVLVGGCVEVGGVEDNDGVAATSQVNGMKEERGKGKVKRGCEGNEGRETTEGGVLGEFLEEAGSDPHDALS
eukprot:610015-Rhodomonas_salina.2